MINAILTVRAHQAGSHQGKGWEEFTDAVIRRLNDEREHIVFMLWGAYAQKKGTFIDRTRHCVLTAPHPSPRLQTGAFSDASISVKPMPISGVKDWQKSSGDSDYKNYFIFLCGLI